MGLPQSHMQQGRRPTRVMLLGNHPAQPNFFLFSPPEPTGDEEVELSVMTDVSVTEETNAQIQGGVDDLNDLIESRPRC